MALNFDETFSSNMLLDTNAIFGSPRRPANVEEVWVIYTSIYNYYNNIFTN